MPSTRIKPFQQEPVCLTSHFVRRPLPDRCRTRPARPIHPTAGAGGSVAGRSGDSKRWPARIFHPPPRTPPITKWRNDAVLRMRSAADAPESYAPATFSPPRATRHRPVRARGAPRTTSGCSLRLFPSATLLRPPLRFFFPYSEGSRGVADGKGRSGRPVAAPARAGIEAASVRAGRPAAWSAGPRRPRRHPEPPTHRPPAADSRSTARSRPSGRGAPAPPP